MGFQTKGLRLPLRRALITAKDTTSPPKVCLPALSCAVAIFIAVFSRYRQLVLLCFHISPVQYPHCLVPSRLSLHVCLNSSREFRPPLLRPPAALPTALLLSRLLLEFAPENQPPPLPTNGSLPRDKAIKCTLRLLTEPRHRL